MKNKTTSVVVKPWVLMIGMLGPFSECSTDVLYVGPIF